VQVHALEAVEEKAIQEADANVPVQPRLQ